MKRIITSGVLFLIALTAVYILWAIQPPSGDDWAIYPVKFFIPSAGPAWRHMTMEIILGNPFSWVKPAIFITDVLVVGMGWIILRNEGLVARFILTVLLALGFPYLGTVATWSVASGMYGESAAEMILWFLFYVTFKNYNQFIISITLFVLTFFTCISHEVWIVAFPWVVLYAILEGVRTKRKRDFFNALCITFGYVLAFTYYMNGLHEYVEAGQAPSSGLFHSVFTLKNLLATVVFGTKENLLLLKDCIPVFLLIAYAKGRNSFKNLESKIFVFLFIGVLSYIYVNYFMIGPPQWRCRWLCACGLTLVFLSIPLNLKQNLRHACLVLSCVWFLYTGFFTYCHTNIDVIGWLHYRNMALRHDPKTLKEDTYWGKQDNKYRFFLPTTIGGIVTKQAFLGAHLNADLIWNDLIESGYIDSNGAIQTKFSRLKNYPDMVLSKMFDAQKKQIYAILQRAPGGIKARVLEYWKN